MSKGAASERTLSTRMVRRRRKRLAFDKYDINRRIGTARGMTILGRVNIYLTATDSRATWNRLKQARTRHEAV